MNNDAFHKKITDTIDKCSYEFYVVRPNKKMRCVCIDHSSKQANPDCKLCLGTGFKIAIKKARGASNEEAKTAGSMGGRSSYTIRTYFVTSNNKLKEDDLVIDDNEIYYVYRILDMRALHGHKTHQQVTAIKRTHDHQMSLNNFNEIMKKYI